LEVALEISRAVQELSRKRKIAVVASSDFSHYEPARVAEAKDSHAISCIVSLQTEEFYRVIRRENISICGPAGIAALMSIIKGVHRRKENCSFTPIVERQVVTIKK